MTPARRPGCETSDMGRSVQEDVLEVETVGLEAYEPEAELGGDVADQVVGDALGRELGRRRVDRDHRAAGPAGEAALRERLAELVALGLGADDLDEQAAGLRQEVAGGARAPQVAGVEHDHVVADLLELAEQVGGDEYGDPELAPDALHQAEHVV